MIWKEVSTSHRILKNEAGIDLHTYVGMAGMPGMMSLRSTKVVIDSIQERLLFTDGVNSLRRKLKPWVLTLDHYPTHSLNDSGRHAFRLNCCRASGIFCSATR